MKKKGEAPDWGHGVGSAESGSPEGGAMKYDGQSNCNATLRIYRAFRWFARLAFFFFTLRLARIQARTRRRRLIGAAPSYRGLT